MSVPSVIRSHIRDPISAVSEPTRSPAWQARTVMTPNDLLFALAGERDEVCARGTEVTAIGSVHLAAEGDELIAQRLPAAGGRELVARLQQRPVVVGQGVDERLG